MKTLDITAKVFLITVLTGAVLLYYFLDPSRNSFFPGCPFHSLTGLYCPGCGSQRAFHSVLHGRFTEAFHQNPLFVTAVPILLVRYGFPVFTSGSNKEVKLPFPNPRITRLVIVLTVFVFWIARNWS